GTLHLEQAHLGEDEQGPYIQGTIPNQDPKKRAPKTIPLAEVSTLEVLDPAARHWGTLGWDASFNLAQVASFAFLLLVALAIFGGRGGGGAQPSGRSSKRSQPSTKRSMRRSKEHSRSMRARAAIASRERRLASLARRSSPRASSSAEPGWTSSMSWPSRPKAS